MNLKRDLAYYWAITENYTGFIDLKKTNTDGNITFYIAETDGNRFEVAIYDDYEETNLFFYHEEGVIGQWVSNALNSSVVELNGNPSLLIDTGERIKPFSEILQEYREKNNITVLNLSKKLGVALRTTESWLAGTRIPDIFKIVQILKILEII